VAKGSPQTLRLAVLSGAIGISALGDTLALIALSFAVKEMSGSGLQVAAIFIAVWSPAAFLAAPAGLLADRREPRKVLALISLLQVPVAVALAFVGSSIPMILLALVLGIGFALGQPSEFALIPAVAGESGVRRANGWIETARYTGFTLGPVVGGVLTAAGGTKLALLIDACTFVAVAGAALWLPNAHSEHEPRPDTGRARDGIVYLFRDRTLGLVMVVALSSLLMMTASATAEVFFATDYLHTGSGGYGLLITGWTLGMATGAAVFAPRLRGALPVIALVAIVIQSVGLGLPTLWLAFGFTLVCWIIGGLAHGTKNVVLRTLIHERVPAHLHGRAYAGYNGARNAAELVAMISGGLIVTAFGARTTLFLAGAIPALFGLAGLAWYASTQRGAEPAAEQT